LLTNGLRYKVYKASEKASAPDKLLFEVSIDPRDTTGLSAEQIASQLNRISRDSMAQGVLDKLGTEIFTTGKVRKALDRLFIDAPQPLIRLIRKAIGDNSVTPSQIQQALGRIWDTGKVIAVTVPEWQEVPKGKQSKGRDTAEYSELHHTEGKPREVIELYKALDRLCQDLAPGRITRAYKAKYVSWSLDKKIFCCAHLQQGGLRVWVKTNPKALDPSESFARDVSKIGHWGVGDVELAIDSLERLRAAEKFVRESFDRETRE
jgi:predicted transport protein